MTDYTDIPWDQGTEDQLVPKGQHMLRIETAEDTHTKGNPEDGTPIRRMVKMMIVADGIEDCAPIFHNLVIPNADEYGEFADADSKRAAKFMLRSANRFFQVFGVKPQEFAQGGATVLMGKSGRCIVSHRMYQNEPQAELQLPRMTG